MAKLCCSRPPASSRRPELPVENSKIAFPRVHLGRDVNSERLEERHDVTVRGVQHLIVVARKLRNLPLAQGVGEPCAGQAVCPVRFLAGLRAEDRRRHAPGLAEARRISRVESDGDPAFRGSVDRGLQLPDERSARPVRFPQPTQVVRLAVVVP